MLVMGFLGMGRPVRWQQRNMTGCRHWSRI
jgi:hypothetical protein